MPIEKPEYCLIFADRVVISGSDKIHSFSPPLAASNHPSPSCPASPYAKRDVTPPWRPAPPEIPPRMNAFTMNFLKLRNLLPLSVLCLAQITLEAVPRLPGIFSDHAVLQADQPINVWGWAEPHSVVTVSFNDDTAQQLHQLMETGAYRCHRKRLRPHHANLLWPPPKGKLLWRMCL